jgi:hypothetical protein
MMGGNILAESIVVGLALAIYDSFLIMMDKKLDIVFCFVV